MTDTKETEEKETEEKAGAEVKTKTETEREVERRNTIGTILKEGIDYVITTIQSNQSYPTSVLYFCLSAFDVRLGPINYLWLPQNQIWFVLYGHIRFVYLSIYLLAAK